MEDLMKKPIIKIRVRSLVGAFVIAVLIYAGGETLGLSRGIISILFFLLFLFIDTIYEEIKSIKMELMLLKKKQNTVGE